jgi:hypothetical protein
MRLVFLSLLAAVAIAATSPSTFAAPLASPYLNPNPQETVEAAFSAPYGELLLKEFTSNLGDSADQGCLASKGLTKATLAAPARAILVRMGVQLYQKTTALMDPTVFKAKLDGLKGAGAHDELTRLLDDPDVRAFNELARPRSLANAANVILENMDRYLIVRRITLKRPLSPLATGNQALIDADPSDDIEDQLDDLVKDKDSPALNRYLDIMDATEEAFKKSVDPKVATRTGPLQLLEGLDRELTAVCIRRPA